VNNLNTDQIFEVEEIVKEFEHNSVMTFSEKVL